MTEAFWKAVLPDLAVPTLTERIRAILLAFEETDYTRAEWNFCQNRPFYAPPQNPVCVSNDKRSYLTWGPHGDLLITSVITPGMPCMEKSKCLPNEENIWGHLML